MIFHLSIIDDSDSLALWADKCGQLFSRWASPQGFVIIANDEREARQIACHGECEGNDTWWLEPSLTKCQIMTDEGNSRIVMGDYPTG